MSDLLIIGGGVVGLSLAYEAAGHSARVRVIDAGRPGREASWAGAGILPPAAAAVDDPGQRLAALSNEMHRHWAEELRAATGIDTGYRRCGAIYLERDAQAAARMELVAAAADAHGVTARRLSPDALAEYEPGLAPKGIVQAAYLVPDECQIRNPRHLKALLIACQARGVEILSGSAAQDFDVHGDRIRAVVTNAGTLGAEQICLTSGAWTAALAQRLGISLSIKPIRGQIVLFATSRPPLARIVNEGSRYLVPRDDGRLLAGSTEEDAGFDRSTTAGGVAGLIDLALSLAPKLADATVERTWAGLRPATADGLPYLGRVPGITNAFVAAGHFRGGLQLSTGTALVMNQLLRGETPAIDLAPFRLDRACAKTGSVSNR